jgi:hypothetical protein
MNRIPEKTKSYKTISWSKKYVQSIYCSNRTSAGQIVILFPLELIYICINIFSENMKFICISFSPQEGKRAIDKLFCPVWQRVHINFSSCPFFSSVFFLTYFVFFILKYFVTWYTLYLSNKGRAQ